MTIHERTIENLRVQGYRLTPQRLLILSIISEGGRQMGIDEIFQKAKAAHRFMDVATVYRTLRLLKRLGAVTELTIGDRLHYELMDSDGRHLHLVCRSCRAACSVSPQYLADFRVRLQSEFRFQADLEHFTVTGLCGICSDQASPESQTVE